MSFIKVAKNFCDENKFRFTKPRKQVLELLLSRSNPMGAYDILEELSTENHKLSPPTIYRAIDFWVEQGFIHKIMSLNSYIACKDRHTTNHIILFICDSCKKVNEVHIKEDIDFFNINDSIKNFHPRQAFTEVNGLCAACTN
ncbi:Fur family transcriptional regulator [Pseudofrancisella aestuarii]|uniref:Ferric uptake regulator family protein n=2 Tax=Francisellaceae TaxID=34064 RepID=A0A1J0KUZ1_9GAMM|nr:MULTISPECIES: transcriptional repressor [Francisellaceae]APC97495.1 ferric uptake regulator family protein [Francisella frigiditurris]